MEVTLPATLGEFFTWFGSTLVIGSVISWVLQNWAWFKEQRSEVKVILLIVIAVGMGVLSQFAIKYVPAGVVEELQPYYQVVLTGVVIVLNALGFHWAIGKREERNNPTGTGG